MLRCDLCSRWSHVSCAAGGGGGGVDDAAATESLTCRECAEGLSRLRIGPTSTSSAAASTASSTTSGLFVAMASHLARANDASAPNETTIDEGARATAATSATPASESDAAAASRALGAREKPGAEKLRRKVRIAEDAAASVRPSDKGLSLIHI